MAVLAGLPAAVAVVVVAAGFAPPLAAPLATARGSLLAGGWPAVLPPGPGFPCLSSAALSFARWRAAVCRSSLDTVPPPWCLVASFFSKETVEAAAPDGFDAGFAGDAFVGDAFVGDGFGAPVFTAVFTAVFGDAFGAAVFALVPAVLDAVSETRRASEGDTAGYVEAVN